jgi:hypothetical protein
MYQDCHPMFFSRFLGYRHHFFLSNMILFHVTPDKEEKLLIYGLIQSYKQTKLSLGDQQIETRKIIKV